MNKPKCVDALGNAIKIGQRYGYSASSGGWQRTVIGIASSVSKDRVTLDVETVKQFLYGEETDNIRDSAPKVLIRGIMIFPVNIA